MRKSTDNQRGVGQCGSPGCNRDRAPDRLVCKDHAKIMDKIREELFGGDYRARFSQGSAEAPKKRRQKLGPTCCFVGCYEPRDPGTPFCFSHQGNESH